MWGQAEFAVNEESFVRKLYLKEGMLFQEERKEWEAAWKDNEALAQWVEQTQQTVKAHVQTQKWKCACTLVQQGLLSMLLQIQSEVAMK